MESHEYSRPDRAAPLALTVPAECAGLRLDQALARLLPSHSRSRLKGWIEAGRVCVDGAPAAPRRKLAGGERIDVAAGDDGTALPDAPQAMDLPIVHEDDAVIVIDKPAGLVVHPGAGNRNGTLLNALLHRHPDLASVARAGIVPNGGCTFARRATKQIARKAAPRPGLREKCPSASLRSSAS